MLYGSLSEDQVLLRRSAWSGLGDTADPSTNAIESIPPWADYAPA